ncbi:MAG: Phage protein [Candidatus Curtissbacteria bacterium GW2011_GWA1_40_9]|uniref:Phage protein n=1 Tax=Candidatus Curtissbacteria bacterium GW2011_GWA1_40_9 TaxID=1618408 RepID=A0A0G0TM29_9BACT|nr:MAG: Phage protein [Candidatus Curtissbacteria bacterium GW2011_GWA1_40_9]
MYKIFFSTRAAKSLKKIPKYYQIKIKDKIEELSNNARLHGTIKLVDYPVAQFRHRVGNYRILFDIDEIEKIIEILDIRKRDEKTYR